MLSKRIAIDLGASVLRLHLKGEGVVFSEPALVLMSLDGARVVGVGVQALSEAGEGRSLRLARVFGACRARASQIRA